ncbi:hypothetical protein GCM10007874_54470 [Labrys miyagiensis]|uniref:Uncharacterized protein n=1 Tax=Labrys miyagiensis TaxID=346912 RepID=A0ABQ6CRS8_9HYPH|nr:hypothetical protein [Labrys miyagiensis]GLS22429.1 hypothetical protein GCM10007874_54470 [Labrys miyagiensis]
MHDFIAAGTVNAAWNGLPQTLAVRGSVTMPQTPNGSLVVGYFNQAQQNNAGRLAFTSGGSTPTIVPVPALARMISILTANWQANNLTLTNTSINAATPIFVQAFGPGIPGMQPGSLTIGTPVQLAMRQAVQGTTTPNWMQLEFSSSTSNLEIVAVVGGPLDQSGNNAYVIALNAPTGDTGPPTVNPPPAGFFATASGNRYSLSFNWGAASIYVVNLSPQTAAPVTALLQSL